MIYNKSKSHQKIKKSLKAKIKMETIVAVGTEAENIGMKEEKNIPVYMKHQEAEYEEDEDSDFVVEAEMNEASPELVYPEGEQVEDEFDLEGYKKFREEEIQQMEDGESSSEEMEDDEKSVEEEKEEKKEEKKVEENTEGEAPKHEEISTETDLPNGGIQTPSEAKTEKVTNITDPITQTPCFLNPSQSPK